ncbi:hypothetical protein KC343_g649 [Hortaea werneckii]|nr:hypothetical protein KC352_g14477 [Hortaea werneckii]KAI7571459.1 hypothetical protein KC317_g1610 [Hortaea werneckii]KAI7627697.1 hypothetical protein KC346_g609 [Hortaea werneckii]KAI7637524.1 hypothetical protein KC343_g649 [Hortaea werneckii]KAI7682638.1 hypothetical protein KC319_g897 [Hortaea werneckii]
MPHTLITGANSFVATYIIVDLISKGHTVTGIVRRTSAGNDLLANHPEWSGKVAFEVVEDYARKGAFDDIFQARGYDYVIHTAAPMPKATALNFDEDFLRPGVDGTLNLLDSANANAPSLKSIAITGSANSVTGTIFSIMARSAEENKVTVLLPALIFGPPPTLEPPNLSVSFVYRFFNGTFQELPDTYAAGLFPTYVDVRDLATAHVRALSSAGAVNQRFLIGAPELSSSLILGSLESFAKNSMPELEARLPKDTGRDDNTHLSLPRFNVNEGNETLSLNLRSAEETFGDVAKKIMELE